MLDEDALVEAARGGDSTAFGQLWQQLAPPVGGYLRSRGVVDVDDVTSEVFMAAFARIADFAGGGVQFRRFIFTLAHHKSVDDTRRRFGPKVPRHEVLDDASDPRSAASAEDEALREVYGEQVQQLLTMLPDVQREVLLLRVVAGLDVSDVASVLGRSSGAIKQLQHRALTTLRSGLNPAGTDRVQTVTADATPPIATTT